MTDTIAHPPLPDAAAYMLSRDLEAFKTSERTASVAVSTLYDGRYEPLFTAQQMREHCEAVALPLLKACQNAVDVLRDRTHIGMLCKAIEQATGEQK